MLWVLYVQLQIAHFPSLAAHDSSDSQVVVSWFSNDSEAPVSVPRKLLSAIYGSAVAIPEKQMSQRSFDIASQKYTGILSKRAGRKYVCLYSRVKCYYQFTWLCRIYFDGRLDKDHILIITATTLLSAYMTPNSSKSGRCQQNNPSSTSRRQHKHQYFHSVSKSFGRRFFKLLFFNRVRKMLKVCEFVCQFYT